jgi:hypothetical protein
MPSDAPKHAGFQFKFKASGGGTCRSCEGACTQIMKSCKCPFSIWAWARQTTNNMQVRIARSLWPIRAVLILVVDHTRTRFRCHPNQLRHPRQHRLQQPACTCLRFQIQGHPISQLHSKMHHLIRYWHFSRRLDANVAGGRHLAPYSQRNAVYQLLLILSVLQSSITYSLEALPPCHLLAAQNSRFNRSLVKR